jgi:hypothetical protein
MLKLVDALARTKTVGDVVEADEEEDLWFFLQLSFVSG